MYVSYKDLQSFISVSCLFRKLPMPTVSAIIFHSLKRHALNDFFGTHKPMPPKDDGIFVLFC